MEPRELPASHPLAAIGGRDNAIMIESRNSGRLFFAGPGAGPDVTAAGVFGDVLAIAQSLGSPPGLSAPLPEPRAQVHA